MKLPCRAQLRYWTRPALVDLRHRDLSRRFRRDKVYVPISRERKGREPLQPGKRNDFSKKANLSCVFRNQNSHKHCRYGNMHRSVHNRCCSSWYMENTVAAPSNFLGHGIFRSFKLRTATCVLPSRRDEKRYCNLSESLSFFSLIGLLIRYLRSYNIAT